MKTSFRIARVNDLPRIVDTYNSVVPMRTVTADVEPVDVDSKTEWFRSHDSKRRPLWIVEADDQYAGWMSFSDFYGRPAYNGTAEISIYLEASMRGKKLGRACMDKAFAEAPGCGIHTLLGFIFSTNITSIRLFETYRFRRWGALPAVAKFDDGTRDLYIFGRRV